ncbi:hypothetical protein WJX77_007681 [Trebouxia sp. C0004]
MPPVAWDQFGLYFTFFSERPVSSGASLDLTTYRVILQRSQAAPRKLTNVGVAKSIDVPVSDVAVVEDVDEVWVLAATSATACVCRSESPIRLGFKRHKADTQAISDSISFIREDVWTVHDFPAEIDKDFPISPAAYQALKKHWIGTPVKPRDPRVTEKLLRSWGMRSWKQYVLDQYLSNY